MATVDGSTSITIGLLLALAGGVFGLLGFLNNRDAKKYSEGKEAGIIEKSLNTMNDTLIAFKDSNELFQKEHREEHVRVDKRIRVIEDDLLVIKSKSTRKKQETN